MLIFICLFIIPVPALATEAPAFRQGTLDIKTSAGNRHFTIEIAETPEQQEYGLMFRKTVPRDHGMLFIMTRDVPMAMWMKDTLIPLDMVFIDSHGRIVYIAANTTPESTDVISAGQPVRAVLELAGGVTASLGIKTGDSVISPYFKP